MNTEVSSFVERWVLNIKNCIFDEVVANLGVKHQIIDIKQTLVNTHLLISVNYCTLQKSEFTSGFEPASRVNFQLGHHYKISNHFQMHHNLKLKCMYL